MPASRQDVTPLTAPDNAAPGDGPIPRHGGALAAAAARYGIAIADWLDLSTGINPDAYTADAICPADFTRLPDPAALASLQSAARAAYTAPEGVRVVAVPGTDMALRILPLLRQPAPVAILSPTYGGHAEAWRGAGHAVTMIENLAEADSAAAVVLANPNNPDGRRTSLVAIRAALDALPANGLMLIDEAFADLEPGLSVVARLADPRLVVLRSFGKFYGLAGLRLGFVLGSGTVVARLADIAGDWPVSGPAVAVGTTALADTAWQQTARQRLAIRRAALDALLGKHGLDVVGGTDLFRLVRHRAAAILHERLAQRGIWTRRFAAPADALRIGLPAEDGFARLAAALADITAEL